MLPLTDFRWMIIGCPDNLSNNIPHYLSVERQIKHQTTDSLSVDVCGLVFRQASLTGIFGYLVSRRPLY